MGQKLSVLAPLILRLSQTGFAAAEPLPDRPDIEMPPDNIFDSSEFQNTEQVCFSMYHNWVPSLHGEGQQHARGQALPPVISSGVRLLYGHKIEAHCEDFRTPGSVRFRNGPGSAGELQFSEKFYLQCNPESEAPDYEPRPSNRDTHYSRLIGVCRSLGPNRPPENRGVEVKAGSSACVDARNAQAQDLMAYLMQDDEDDNERSLSELWTEWMNISEVGTSRQVHNTRQSMLKMKGDRSGSRTYRACARMQAGHGNARLFLVSI